MTHSTYIKLLVHQSYYNITGADKIHYQFFKSAVKKSIYGADISDTRQVKFMPFHELWLSLYQLTGRFFTF